MVGCAAAAASVLNINLPSPLWMCYGYKKELNVTSCVHYIRQENTRSFLYPTFPHIKYRPHCKKIPCEPYLHEAYFVSLSMTLTEYWDVNLFRTSLSSTIWSLGQTRPDIIKLRQAGDTWNKSRARYQVFLPHPNPKPKSDVFRPGHWL